MRNVVAVLLLPIAACVDLRSAGAPGPAASRSIAASAAPELVLPAGYAAEPVAEGLDDPRAVAFDRAGTPYVLEGRPARLSRIAPDGTRVAVASGGANGPWTGLARVEDSFYVAEAGDVRGGRILRIDTGGAPVPVGGDLPAGGVLGPLAAAPDGQLYLGVATAAAGTGGGRDVPCQDVRLRGGGRIEGAVPCTGSVLRIDPGGGGVAVHAWGFTNPMALAFTPQGRLLVADDLAPAADLVWDAVPGVWYGWPDYLGQVATADPHLAVHPNPPPPPVATLDGDVAALAVADAPAFGGPMQAFVALTPPGGAGQVAFTTVGSGVTVPFAANLRRPAVLAFAPDGRSLWVADAATGRMWRIAAQGGRPSTDGRIVP